MNYRQRITTAIGISLAINLCFAIGLAAALFQQPRQLLGLGPRQDPLVLNLRPEHREEVRLVEAPVPSDTAPEDTNLIAEQHSRAADIAPTQGQDSGPADVTPSEFEELASVPPIPPAPAVPAPAPPPAPTPERTQVARHAETRTQPSAPATRPALAAPDPLDVLEPLIPLEEESQEAEEPSAMEPFDMAALPPTPAIPAPPRAARGSSQGAAIGEGFTSFDAIKDDIAPYLRNVKERVERRWREALLTRYSGTTATEATIDCAISPEGEVVSVEVAGTPNDRIYAALCKQAIERAGPFGPFTFEVPEMYRNKNLEIRWTFSFLRR